MAEKHPATDTLAPGRVPNPALAGAFADLERHGWFVVTGIRQPGRPVNCSDAVLVGPGGVLVVESAPQKKNSLISSMANMVVALVPAEVRRHVQSVVCPPAERGDSDAVRVQPGVLAAFARSMPQVLGTEAVVAVAEALRNSLTGVGGTQLWTVSKVLEWTKHARASEPTNRAGRRAAEAVSRAERVANWVGRHAVVLTIVVVLLALLGVFAR